LSDLPKRIAQLCERQEALERGLVTLIRELHAILENMADVVQAHHDVLKRLTSEDGPLENMSDVVQAHHDVLKRLTSDDGQGAGA
jgi:hypothetical protein